VYDELTRLLGEKPADTGIKVGKKNVDRLLQELKELQNKIKDLTLIKQNLSAAGEVSRTKDILAHLESIENELSTSRKILEHKEARKRIYLGNFDSVEHLEERKQSTSKIRKEIEILKNSMDKLETERRFLQAKLDFISNQKSLLQHSQVKEEQKCPTCRKTLIASEISALLVTISQETNSIRTKITETSEEILPLSRELKETKNSLEEALEAIARIPELKSLILEINDLRNQIQRKENDYNKLKKE
ncbi:MAG: hypothetical protein ACFFD4_32850, partial [Candidatus Odinarchaeota archaeon]